MAEACSVCIRREWSLSFGEHIHVEDFLLEDSYLNLIVKLDEQNKLQGEGEMLKAASGLVIALLLISIYSSVFSIQPVKAAATVYVMADGSVVPAEAPILNVGNVSYTFTADINDSLVVERDNIVVDGSGYTLLGNGTGYGVSLSERTNVTIKKPKN